MARLRDTILGNRGYAERAYTPVVDLKNGAQMGPMTDFTGYVSNAAYVRRNLIAVLIEAPRGFQDMSDPTLWVETLKSLVELHPKSIEGLQGTITAEFVENAAGGAGEMQEDVSNVTQARSNPTFVWTEKYGKPINKFLSQWIRMLMMDPITKFAGIVSTGVAPADLLPDYSGMTVLFIEPDPTHTRVQEAYLCTNMHPKTAGEVTGRRDITQGGESIDYSVEFTALTQHGAGVQTFAQNILDSMNLNGMNPNLQRAFVQNIEADVRAGQQGYAETLDNNARTQVP